MILKKVLLVMNPYAGLRRGKRYLADVVALFNRADYQVLAHMTAGQGDCTRIVAEMAGDVDLVVCAGGDGTFNEAVTGLMRSGCNVPIGYLPCGSTNDFAASLKLSTNVVQAAKDILEGVPTPVDVGCFADRYFTYVASFGAFTKASYATPQNVKNALGHVAYVLEGIQELSQIRRTHVRFELENRVIEDDFIFGAVSNSTSVGGILTLSPELVDLQDGKFELLLVRAPRDAMEVAECIRALRTQKYNCAMITFLSTDKLLVKPDPKMIWTLDGERADGAETISVQNIHRAIRLMKRG